MTHRWHVAFTDTRAEQETCADIRDIGFDAFTPMERHKRFTRGRKVYYEQALFPRYLFACFDIDDPHWNSIRKVDGVCDILCNDGKPSPVPFGLTEKLQHMQRLGLFDHTKAPNPFPPGSNVILDDDGPFASLLAKVLKVRTADRCLVLLSYLGREMSINVPMARLSHI